MIPLEKINPHIRFAKTLSVYYKQASNSICYDCRLFYMQKGNGSIRINGKEYAFGADAVIYLPPATKYQLSFENYNDITMHVFNFDLTSKYSEIVSTFGTATEENYVENKDLMFEIPDEFSKPIFLPHAPHLLNPLKQCITEHFNKEQFFRMSISAKFKLVLTELLKDSPQFGCNNLVLQVYDYIHTQCDLSTVTPKEIADHFHYHPYYLSKIMKSNTGKTLQQYLTYYRIKKAKNYLTSTNLDVTFIGDRVGFNSTAYFIKVFKEFTGQTPIQYRKTHIFF